MTCTQAGLSCSPGQEGECVGLHERQSCLSFRDTQFRDVLPPGDRLDGPPQCWAHSRGEVGTTQNRAWGLKNSFLILFIPNAFTRLPLAGHIR